MAAEEELTLRASVVDEMTAPLERIERQVTDIGEAAARTGRRAGQEGAGGLTRFERAADRLRGSLHRLDDRLNTLSRRMDHQFGRVLKRTAQGLGILSAAAVTFGVRAASNFQATQIAFETLLGSTEKGQRLFRELQAINLKTPFELKDLAAGEQLLLRYNIEGERSVGILKGLADVAALSDAPTENLERMARAVGQIFTSGRLQGQDALQLVQAGINAYDVYAQKLGITQAAARKLGEEGKLDANILLEAITNLDGPLEKFRGGAEKMSKTLLGQLSNLKDALNVGLADAAAPLVDELGVLIGTPDKPGILVDGLQGLVRDVGPPLFQVVSTILRLFSRALPAAKPILNAIADGLDRLLTAAGPGLRALEPLGGAIGDSLIHLVDALVPVMPELVELFGAFIQLLPAMIDILASLVPLVQPMARLLTTLLGWRPLRGIFAGLLVVLLGYRALAGPVGAMFKFARALQAIAVGQAAVTAASGAGGAAGAAGGAAGAAARGGLLRGAAGAVGAVAPYAVAAAPYVGVGVAFTGASLADERARDRASRRARQSRDDALIAGQSPGASAAERRRAAELVKVYERATREEQGDARAPARDRWAEMMTPGARALTSNRRSVGVLPGSGHLTGDAFDRAGSWMARYRENVRRAGGWAVQERGHVHADFGDAPAPARSAGGRGMPAAWAGGGPLVYVAGNVYGMDDLERWVREARRRQDREDRRRQRSVQGTAA